MVSNLQLLRIQLPAGRDNCFGLFRKMEANVLEKIRPGEFRWYGFLAPEERDEQGRLLYQIIDPMVANEPVRERPAGN